MSSDKRILIANAEKAEHHTQELSIRVQLSREDFSI